MRLDTIGKILWKTDITLLTHRRYSRCMENEPMERERINPTVLPDTARRIRVEAATHNCSIGEVIDTLAAALPAVPTKPEERS